MLKQSDVKSEQPGVFLEIVTRTFGGRPNMLAANMASLREQTSGDWVQTLLVDEERRGVAYANKQMRTLTPEARYLWLLDDDDLCIRPTLVAELAEIAQLNAPDVIFIRMDHGPKLGILPGGLQWGNRKLMHGHIGCSGFVVSRETWLRFRQCWGESYHGDFEFISVVAAGKDVRVYWHDCIASRVQRVSNGESEGRVTAMKYRANTDVRVLLGGRVLELVAGREYELDAPEAPDLVRAGYVTPVIAPVAPESAAVAPSERAVVPKATPKTEGKPKRAASKGAG
jgi:hypothetical protein